MANKDDLNQANTGAPAADIPDLKKKDKERKKAGAAWSGAKPGAGSFSGATGGTVARAAASAAGAAGEAAAGAAAAGAAGGFSFSSFIAGLMATMAGKMAIAAAAILLLAGGAMIAAGLLKGGGANGAGGAMGDLGALSSSMKIRNGGSDRTGYVASNGEIAFDPVKGGAAKPAEKAPADAAPAGDAANPLTPQPEENKDAGFNRPGLDHNLSGSKLSSSLGGGFGNKNIFSGNNASNKLGDAMGKFNIKGGEKGRMSATRAASRTGKVASGTGTRGMKANKAFGQLKVARGASMIGAGSSGAEAAKNAAANAFDGGNLGGSTVGGAPPGAAPTGNVDTPSTPGGAPDMTGGPDAPTVPTQDLGAVTAAAIAAIAQMAAAAAKMKMIGMALIVVGLALVAMGCSTFFTAWLIPIGLAIAAMGYMMVSQSQKLKAQADEMSNQLAQRTTDQRQNAINKYCIDKAYAGTPPANCNPPDDLTGKQDFQKATEDGAKNNDRIIREDGRVEGDTGKAL